MEQDAQLHPAADADIPATNIPRLRTASGQFAGIAPVPWPRPMPVTRYTAPRSVTDEIDAVVTSMLAAAAGHDPKSGSPAPAVALAPSPGSGKTTRTQQLLAERPRDDLGGDAVVLMPTSALSGEACARANQLAAGGIATPAVQMLGRSAPNPEAPQERMCRKWELAEKAARAGLRVRDSLCEAPDTGDKARARCPHFETCAYLGQFAALPAAPVDRYAAHAFTRLPDPTQRDVGLRVIDERFWPSMVRTTVVPAADFAPERPCPEPGRDPDGRTPPREAQGVLDAARKVLAALRSDRGFRDLPYVAEDYQAFARQERSLADKSPGIAPDMSASLQEARIEQLLASGNNAHRYARIWEALARARAQSREWPDCVELRQRTYREPESGCATEVEEIVVHGLQDLAGDPPTLVLDADADETILSTFFPDIEVHHATLEPNAEILQVSSHRMSTTALLGAPDLRDRCRRLIEAEVARDRAGPAGGVLVGCTKKVARQFFRDAELLTGRESAAEEVDVMLGTPLFGASWLWFGDRALGSNRYETYASVVVLGRNEVPLDALEGQGRSLFGDRDGAPPLHLVAPDAQGRRLMPEVMVPYELRSGDPVAVPVRLHPDRRIRALQRQHRECATRQLVERLRLGRATTRKRVILACNIPVPGLPVDRLLTLDEIAGTPSRLRRALEETARCHRTLILTAKELPAHAGGTFPTTKAAQDWLSRTRKNPRTAIGDLHGGVRGFRLEAARIKRDRPRARPEVCLVLVRDGESVRDVIEAAHGRLSAYRRLHDPAKEVFGGSGP